MGKKPQPSYSNQLNNSAVTEALRRQEQEKQQASQYLTDPNNVDERGAIQRELSNMDLNRNYREKGVNALVQNRDVPEVAQPIPFVKQAMAQPRVAGEQTQPGMKRGQNFRSEWSDNFVTNPESLGLDANEMWIAGKESKFQTDLVNKAPVRDKNGKVIDWQENPNRPFGIGQITQGNRMKLAEKLGISDYNTINPQEQAAMMKEYIRQRYGTSDNAVAFWRATESKNPNIAPPELQKDVQLWIKNGWVGY